MKASRKLVMGLLALALTGCETQYTYSPPLTSQGQQCVAECTHRQQSCKAHEDDHAIHEKSRCEMRADIEYTACLRYASTDKDRNACRRDSCYQSPGYYKCDSEFRQCFQVCGGTIGVLK